MIHRRSLCALSRVCFLPILLSIGGFRVHGKETPAIPGSRETTEVIYLRGVALEEGSGGFEKDEARAAECYRRAAEKNYVPAQYNLALLYEEGRGVPQNLSQAAKWYRAAAEAGDADAQNNLGRLYAFGNGVPQNPQQAVYWYTRSSAGGNAIATNNLANSYREGRGVEPNAERALELYRSAALTGYAAAQNNLGLMYANGEGVERNYCVAYAWLNLAVLKLPAVAKTRDALVRKMTADDILQAERIKDTLRVQIESAQKEALAK